MCFTSLLEEGQREVNSISHKYGRIVTLSELAENDYNLNISRFIDTSEAEVEVDIKAVHVKLSELEQREAEIDEKLAGFLKELGV